MDHDSFVEFAEVIGNFGKLIKALDDHQTRELIKLRVKFGSDHKAFFTHISYTTSFDPDLVDNNLKFREIYASLYRCTALGHKEVFEAFETDLARAAVRLKVNEIFEDYPELDQDDYSDMLRMSKEEFLNIMEQRQQARLQADYDRSDKDENGNIIYY